MRKNIILNIVIILGLTPSLFSQGVSYEDRTSNYFLQRGLFSVNYNLSFPFGDLHDFIPATGVAGF